MDFAMGSTNWHQTGCFLTWEQVAESTTCASALKDDNMVVHQLFGA
jgi:hypothetical protein